MKTIVHLSDLHFGRVYEPLLTPLAEKINDIKPDVIAISGDVTMRATTAEFLKAREFLDRLPFPKIIVPGNHDIPLYNFYSRFFKALKKYKRYITDDLEPVYITDGLAIYGLNTARSFAVKRGRLDLQQVQKICEAFSKLPPDAIKIIVTHHPIDLPNTFRLSNLARRHHRAMDMFIQAKIDIFLAGHTHTSLVAHIPERSKLMGHAPLIIQAGTSTSLRTRGEKNSFNILQLAYPFLKITNYLWDPEHTVFKPFVTQQFIHTEKGWLENG